MVICAPVLYCRRPIFIETLRRAVRRLGQHIAGKEFWERALIAVSLTNSHIGFHGVEGDSDRNWKWSFCAPQRQLGFKSPHPAPTGVRLP